MATVTAQLLVDLDDTGNFSTDISAYWVREAGWDAPGIGRNKDLGLAEPSKTSFVLDNRDGRFTPKNSGGAYYNTWHPYHRIKAIVSFNAVNYELFSGIITGIRVDPGPKVQRCYVQAEDMMYVLRRTDIRCPLMSGYTGPIINRLLDYAELGEKVTNPRFDAMALLGGYTATGGASIARITSGPILEGAAACRVTAPGPNDGIRYSMAGLNGVKITAAAYAWYEGSTPNNIQVVLRDNIGTIAAGGATSVYGRWIRLSVTGTYNVGSTSQYIDVEANTGLTSPFVLGALHATPFNAAIPRAVDEGQSWLDAFSWYRPEEEEDALSAIQQVVENELGALFYMDAGTAIFEDKVHRWLGVHTASQATFTERDPDYREEGNDRIGDIVLDYPRFTEGEPGTVLWELDRVPLTIDGGSSMTFEIDYGGSWAKNLITPVAGVDYLPASLTLLNFEDWGAGAEITLETPSTVSVELTYLALRGTPIRIATDRTPARATGASGPTLSASLTHSFKLNGRATSVEAWASYLANRYDDQQPRVSLELSATFPTAATTTDMTQMLARKVSDRITVVNTTLPFSTKLNQDFYIDSISRRFNPESVECSWALVPVDASYFRVGISTIGGADVIAP